MAARAAKILAGEATVAPAAVGPRAQSSKVRRRSTLSPTPAAAGGEQAGEGSEKQPGPEERARRPRQRQRQRLCKASPARQRLPMAAAALLARSAAMAGARSVRALRQRGERRRRQRMLLLGAAVRRMARALPAVRAGVRAARRRRPTHRNLVATPTQRSSRVGLDPTFVSPGAIWLI